MANTLRFKRGLVATIPTALAGEPLFTTDTFDLYIGNGGGNTRFQKYIASGTTSQLLRGDGSLLTMPIVLTSPSNGQVLKFNGTNWVNDSDAGVTGSGTTNYLPKWTSGSALGNSVIFESGNSIGIGTITPQAYTNYSVLEISNTTGGVLRLKNTAATALFEVATNTSETYIKNISNTPMWFGVNNTEGMRLTSTGLGIGTTSPSAKISIVGDSELASFTSSTLGGAYSVFKHFNLGPGGTAWRGNVMGANIKIVSYAPAIDVAGFGASAIVYGSDTNQGFLKFFTTNSTVSGTPLSLSMLLATDASATFYNTVNINAVAWLQFNGANTLLGEGTNTYLQANGSGSIIFRNNTPSELMRITSGGSVGIGTTSPSYKLDVNGEINAVTRYRVNAGIKTNQLFGDGAAFSTSNTNDLGIRNDSGNILFASGGATVQLLLNTFGNLGLGVTPSAWGSDFKGIDIAGTTASFISSSSRNISASNTFYNGTSYIYKNSDFALMYWLDRPTGQYRWYNAPSGTAGAAITFTQAMTLNASGNLSIGNTNDTYKLDVNGTGMFSSTVNIVANASAQNLVIQGRSSDNYGQILFYSNNTATRYGYLQSGSPYGGTVALVGDGGARIDLDNRGLNVTGAATFSSSVTATNYLMNRGGGQWNIIPSSGANYLYFQENTGNKYIMTLDGVNQRVGIGTTSPSYKLVVRGESSTHQKLAITRVASDVAALFLGSNSSEQGMIAANSADLLFGTDISNTFTERLRITSGGNVGIGNTSASAKLHVTGNILSYTEAANTASLFISANNSYNWQFGIGNNSNFVITEGGGLNAIGTERLRITSGGNVGIGTTSPAAKLHLVDSVESEIRTQYSTTSSGKLITGNGFTTIGSITNDPLVFVSNNTERMRFTNGGNLLLGSTSDTGEKFQVTGAGIVSGLFTVSGSTGIPATTATYIRFASGFASPDIGRMYIGDGSGWKFHMSKRLSSTTTDLITFFDNGSVQTSAPTGYAAKPYKLGEVLTGATTADRSIAVEIDGTVYFLLASTTLP